METTIQQTASIVPTIVATILLGLVGIAAIWGAYRLGRKESLKEREDTIAFIQREMNRVEKGDS